MLSLRIPPHHSLIFVIYLFATTNMHCLYFLGLGLAARCAFADNPILIPYDDGADAFTISQDTTYVAPATIAQSTGSAPASSVSAAGYSIIASVVSSSSPAHSLSIDINSYDALVITCRIAALPNNDNLRNTSTTLLHTLWALD